MTPGRRHKNPGRLFRYKKSVDKKPASRVFSPDFPLIGQFIVAFGFID